MKKITTKTSIRYGKRTYYMLSVKEAEISMLKERLSMWENMFASMPMQTVGEDGVLRDTTAAQEIERCLRKK